VTENTVALIERFAVFLIPGHFANMGFLGQTGATADKQQA
jgi:hypothetical protein